MDRRMKSARSDPSGADQYEAKICRREVHKPQANGSRLQTPDERRRLVHLWRRDRSEISGLAASKLRGIGREFGREVDLTGAN